MGDPVRIVRVSVEDYLAGEREAETRHEYVDGELFAMGGASREHNTISFNLAASLGPHLRGGPCRAASSDMKVRAATSSRYYYPDLVVSCNDPAEEPDAYVETRPTLVVEILSPSTAAIDRREKRVAYLAIETLQEYVLIAQDRAEVVVHRREGDDWLMETFVGGERVELGSIGFALDVDELYRGVL